VNRCCKPFQTLRPLRCSVMGMLFPSLLIRGHNEFRYFFRSLIDEGNAILGCVFLCLNPCTDSFFIFRCEPMGARHDPFDHTNGFFHLFLYYRKRNGILFRYKSTAFTWLFKMMHCSQTLLKESTIHAGVTIVGHAEKRRLRI
jgi:hypothetical protein